MARNISTGLNCRRPGGAVFEETPAKPCSRSSAFRISTRQTAVATCKHFLNQEKMGCKLIVLVQRRPADKEHLAHLKDREIPKEYMIQGTRGTGS